METSASFVLGYHGTDEETGERILKGETPKFSDNKYDWLGHGMYFWESDPLRAREWAELWCSRRKKETPFVVGAIIELGQCLDLFSRNSIKILEESYKGLQASRSKIPRNAGKTSDFELRHLDCAVIEYLHATREYPVAGAALPPYQTVRGLFREGEPIYENAGFYEKTHIQIAVRDHTCIKGFFRPR